MRISRHISLQWLRLEGRKRKRGCSKDQQVQARLQLEIGHTAV